jgi:DNA polymerase IV
MILSRNILHLDLDTFFVSVERLKNSKLMGKPILIGGFSDRAVVASCSYEARKYGVSSAMPMKLARNMCPDAIIIRGDMELYSNYSRMVTDIIAERHPCTRRHRSMNTISTLREWTGSTDAIYGRTSSGRK